MQWTTCDADTTVGNYLAAAVSKPMTQWYTSKLLVQGVERLGALIGRLETHSIIRKARDSKGLVLQQVLAVSSPDTRLHGALIHCKSSIHAG